MQQIPLVLFTLLIGFTNGWNVSLSVFLSNSSILNTLQAGSFIGTGLQLVTVEDLEIARKADFYSKCNVDRAESRLSTLAGGTDGSPISILIDGSCSEVAEAVSDSPLNQSIKVIFSSTSSSINNNTNMTSDTFRTVPSDRTIPVSLKPLLDYFDWNQFSLVTSVGVSQYDELKRLILNQVTAGTKSTVVEMIDVDSTLSTSSDFDDTIRALFDNQPHLYLLNTDIQTGIHFLCQGYTEMRYYPNYLWILPSWWYQVDTTSQWWDNPSLIGGTSCTGLSDLRTVLNRSLILRPVPDANRTTNDQVPVFNVSDTVEYSSNSYALDASLSLMLALNETISIKAYSELVAAFRAVSFYGASGFVSFDEDGDRANTVMLVQQIKADQDDTISVVDVAISAAGSDLTLIDDAVDSQTAIFPDGVPPDGTPIKDYKTIELGITIFIALLCFAGLILAIVCLVFNIAFKDRKIVKLTSPNLNYFLLAGVITLLSGMIFYVIGTTNLDALIVICLLRRLLVSIGHDIGFTVALVKTWRIHHIFKNPSPNKRAPKDWKLLLIAFSIVAIDTTVSVILLIIDALDNQVGFVRDREHSPETNEQGVRVEFCSPSCGTTTFYLGFLAFTMLFKITIHIIAVVLSFRIRKIVVDTLNDFKYTSVIVYTSTVLIVILVVILITTVNFINTYGAIVPFLVFLEVLIFLIFSFVPKMIGLYKDPKGLHVMDKPNRDHEKSDIGGSLRRNVSLSYYSRKGSSLKEDELGSDSGRCTLDSKDQNNVNVHPKIPEEEEEKIEDSVFVENGGSNSNGKVPTSDNSNHVADDNTHKQETDV